MLVSVTQHFCQELKALEPFGEGNPPVFRIRTAEVVATRQHWCDCGRENIRWRHLTGADW